MNEPLWLNEIRDYHDFFSGILLYGLGINTHLSSFQNVSGGDINSCAVLILDNQEKLFIKWNETPLVPVDFFEVEAQNLKLLGAVGAPVPSVIGMGKWDAFPYLVLTFFEASSWQDPICDEHLGQYLAAMHRNATSETFGLHYNNYIGTLSQLNTPKINGIDFLVHNRLLPMAGRAYYEEIIDLGTYKKIEQLTQNLGNLIPNPSQASLLHGDFHYNNVLHDYAARVLFIDPACYYGFREMDLAVAELFQGFSPYFFEAYQEVYPLESNWRKTLKLFQLYPLLVHINLFPTQKAYQTYLIAIVNQYL